MNVAEVTAVFCTLLALVYSCALNGASDRVAEGRRGGGAGGGGPMQRLRKTPPRPTRTTKLMKKVRKTYSPRLDLAVGSEDCDYIAYYCLRAYITSYVCARTYFYYYQTFPNYCMMDYVNCMEKNDVWEVLHMGKCVENIQKLQEGEYTLTVLIAKVYELSGGREEVKLHPARKSGWTKPEIIEKRGSLSTRVRSLPSRVNLEEHCDYTLYFCLAGYRTGSICVRTVMWRYYDFDNYCMLEYINCLEGYDVYSLAYMGRCQSNLSYLMPRVDQVPILHVLVNLRAATGEANSLSPFNKYKNIEKHKIAIENFKKFSAPRLSRRQYGLDGIDLTKMTKEEFEALQGKTDEPYDGIIWTTTEPTTIMRRTVPYRVSLQKECDYLAFICMKAYKTGPVCGRTMYHTHHTFDNYCQLDYMNCEHAVMEVWQVVHMGKCLTMDQITRVGALANAADLDPNESWLRNDYVRT